MTNLPVLFAQTGPRTHLAGSRGTMSDTEAADERIRRLEAEVDELRDETAQGRKAAAAAEVRTPSTTTKRRSRLALPPPSLATTRFPSLPFSAHHSTPLTTISRLAATLMCTATGSRAFRAPSSSFTGSASARPSAPLHANTASPVQVAA